MTRPSMGKATALISSFQLCDEPLFKKAKSFSIAFQGMITPTSESCANSGKLKNRPTTTNKRKVAKKLKERLFDSLFIIFVSEALSYRKIRWMGENFIYFLARER